MAKEEKAGGGWFQPRSDIQDLHSDPVARTTTSHMPTPCQGSKGNGMCHVLREERGTKHWGALVIPTTSCVLVPKSKERQLARGV